MAATGYDASLFARIAAIEADSFWFRERNRLLVSTLKRHFPSARELLDVGCGAGGVLAALRSAFPALRLVGTDLFEEGLALARARVPDAEFAQRDARDLPYDEDFDVVGAFDVLEHVDRDDLMLRSMYRATRSGGGIVVLVPQHRRLWNDMDVVARHQRRYSRNELVERTRAAGFDVRVVTSFVTALMPAMAISRVARRLSGRPYDPVRELKPRGLNTVFERVLRTERHLIERGVSLPFGGSLLLVAYKP